MQAFKYNLYVIEYEKRRYISIDSLLLTCYKALQACDNDSEKQTIEMLIRSINTCNHATSLNEPG